MLTILLKIQTEKLLELIKSFYTATGAKVAIFGVDFQELLAFPPQQSAVCMQIKSSPQGARRCRESDAWAQRLIAETGRESMIYTCHAGLREAIAPIVENGLLIGYMMIGQCVGTERPPEEAWRDTLGRCSPYVNLTYLKGEFLALPRVSEEQLRALVTIMHACASYISLKEYLTASQEGTFARVRKYVADNLGEDLSADAICTALYISRNTLFKTVREETGLTLGRYVLGRRLERAKRLLRETGEPVSAIAGMCGVSDFNYFSRVFKRECGVTPREYRRGTGGTEGNG